MCGSGTGRPTTVVRTLAVVSKLLDPEPVRTILSVWSWFVLGVTVLTIVPIVAIVRLVTAPFDPGRYHAGLLFRKIAVVHQKFNPMWKFSVSGEVPIDGAPARTSPSPTTRASPTSC